MSFKLFFKPETINQANASRRGLLDVPTEEQNPTLVLKGTNKKWRELIEIKDTQVVPWESDPNVARITVQFRVTPECPYEPNKNRVLTKTYWLTVPAVTDPKHKDHKKAMMTVGKLNAMIRGAGLEIQVDENGQVPYHIYFNGDPENESGLDMGDKPLIGKQVWGVIRDYTYESETKGVVNDQDVDNFIPLDV